LWKNAVSCSVEESFKKLLDLDPDADNFQILSVIHCTQFHLWEKFMKILSVFVM